MFRARDRFRFIGFAGPEAPLGFDVRLIIALCRRIMEGKQNGYGCTLPWLAFDHGAAAHGLRPLLDPPKTKTLTSVRGVESPSIVPQAQSKLRRGAHELAIKRRRLRVSKCIGQ